jgi:hypothetical protein
VNDDEELLQRLKAHAAVNGKRLQVWRSHDGNWQASVLSASTGHTEKTSAANVGLTPLDAALAVWSEGVELYI